MQESASPQPRKAAPERRCLVNAVSGSKDPLIRFVLSPDFVVTPDLAETLPGRGFYVTADPILIQQAIDKKLFARAAKHQCSVPDNLIATISTLLSTRIETLLGLGKKSAQLVLGEETVVAALKSRKLGLLLIASDASPRTAADMQQRAENAGISACFALPATTMGGAIGRDNAVYVGVNSGKFADSVRRDCARLSAFVTRAS